jgi:hypothetical protein
MAAAIDALFRVGFAPDGQTREETVRVPTRSSPVFGRSGGELAKVGGRQRFALTGTDIKATVGRRTVAIYRIVAAGLAGVAGIATVDTADSELLQMVLASLPNQKHRG